MALNSLIVLKLPLNTNLPLDIVYISEVNGARKVKSDAQIAMNKNSDQCRNFSLRVSRRQCPRLKSFQTEKNSKRVKKLDSSYSG